MRESATSGKVLGLVLHRESERGRVKGKKVGDVARGGGGFGGGSRRTAWAPTVRV